MLTLLKNISVCARNTTFPLSLHNEVTKGLEEPTKFRVFGQTAQTLVNSGVIQKLWSIYRCIMNFKNIGIVHQCIKINIKNIQIVILQ